MITPEKCDDGATSNGNGCSSTCTLETGYSCEDLPSTCSPVCGDGIRTGTEGCDDANRLDIVGCESDCSSPMPGYTCVGLTPDVCTETCGDSTITFTEQCDDTNSSPNDGCDSSC